MHDPLFVRHIGHGIVNCVAPCPSTPRPQPLPVGWAESTAGGPASPKYRSQPLTRQVRPITPAQDGASPPRRSVTTEPPLLPACLGRRRLVNLASNANPHDSRSRPRRRPRALMVFASPHRAVLTLAIFDCKNTRYMS